MATCEDMAEMLSAWHDGELDAFQVACVEEHLDSCPRCRELRDRLTVLDSMVIRFSPIPGPDLEEKIQRALVPPPPRRGMRRLLSMATAALVLIAVSLALLVTGDRADARRMATQYMTSLETISDQVIETQDAMLKTMEWDLNAMKLMVGCSELESKEALPLLNQINGLLQEVERLQKNNELGTHEDKTKGDKQ